MSHGVTAGEHWRSPVPWFQLSLTPAAPLLRSPATAHSSLHHWPFSRALVHLCMPRSSSPCAAPGSCKWLTRALKLHIPACTPAPSIQQAWVAGDAAFSPCRSRKPERAYCSLCWRSSDVEAPVPHHREHSMWLLAICLGLTHPHCLGMRSPLQRCMATGFIGS